MSVCDKPIAKYKIDEKDLQGAVSINCDGDKITLNIYGEHILSIIAYGDKRADISVKNLRFVMDLTEEIKNEGKIQFRKV